MRKKKKETIECDKNTITCDVGTAQCKDGTIKCEKKIKEPPNGTIVQSHVMLVLRKKGGGGRPCVTHSLGYDHKGNPPLRNVGLSHIYCDWGAIDLTLTPQES